MKIITENLEEITKIRERLKSSMPKGIDYNTLIFELQLDRNKLSISEIKDVIFGCIVDNIIFEEIKKVNSDEIRILKCVNY